MPVPLSDDSGAKNKNHLQSYISSLQSLVHEFCHTLSNVNFISHPQLCLNTQFTQRLRIMILIKTMERFYPINIKSSWKSTLEVSFFMQQPFLSLPSFLIFLLAPLSDSLILKMVQILDECSTVVIFFPAYLSIIPSGDCKSDLAVVL